MNIDIGYRRLGSDIACRKGDQSKFQVVFKGHCWILQIVDNLNRTPPFIPSNEGKSVDTPFSSSLALHTALKGGVQLTEPAGSAVPTTSRCKHSTNAMNHPALWMRAHSAVKHMRQQRALLEETSWSVPRKKVTLAYRAYFGIWLPKDRSRGHFKNHMLY